MRALTWHGKHDVRMETVDDPEIVNPRDCVIKVTSTAICSSDPVAMMISCGSPPSASART